MYFGKTEQSFSQIAAPYGEIIHKTNLLFLFPIGRKINETMIQTLTILTVLRLLGDAKSNCSRGYITYERIPNHKLIGFQEKMGRYAR